MTYTDIHGIVHFLDDDITNNLSEIEQLNKKYAQKAKKLASQSNKNIFYCLHQFNKLGRVIQANYFLIPIEDEDVQRIKSIFSKGYYIGIEYSK